MNDVPIFLNVALASNSKVTLLHLESEISCRVTFLANVVGASRMQWWVLGLQHTHTNIETVSKLKKHTVPKACTIVLLSHDGHVGSHMQALLL
jgi:hypothetical protein